MVTVEYTHTARKIRRSFETMHFAYVFDRNFKEAAIRLGQEISGLITDLENDRCSLHPRSHDCECSRCRLINRILGPTDDDPQTSTPGGDT